MKFSYRCVILPVLLVLIAVAPEAKISVKGGGNAWTLESDAIKATLDIKTMAVDVLEKKSKTTWKMARSGPSDLTMIIDGRSQTLSLSDIDNKIVRPISGVKQGVSVELPDQNLTILVYLEEATGKLVFELIPKRDFSNFVTRRFNVAGWGFSQPVLGEIPFAITAARYPRSFDIPAGSDAYVVVPTEQGIIVPSDLDQNFNFPGGGPGAWRMSWWGGVSGKAGYIGIVEEGQEDARLGWFHKGRGPSSIYPIWNPSLGWLRYTRKASYSFLPKTDYVGLAKAFRAYAKTAGKFKTLVDKAKDNPNINKLKGVVNLTVRISDHDFRTFRDRYITFATGDSLVQEAKKALGIKNAVVYLRGWGARGYDNLHPDFLPPMLRAGGPKGIKKFSESVDDMGYLFGLHDNYSDIYWDAPSFDKSILVKDRNGNVARRNMWQGGLNSKICPAVSLFYVKRNFKTGKLDYPSVPGLLDMMTLTFFRYDNFAVIYECHDPNHPLSNEESREAMVQHFQFLQDNKVIAAIEHIKDWCVPYIDYSKCRIPRLGVLGEDRSAGAVAIPVPLWNMIYHDCLAIPEWGMRGDSYIPWQEAFLRVLLYGHSAGINLPLRGPKESYWRELLATQLHEAIAFDELVTHRFVSADRSQQETEFSSGVKVWVDFKERKYKITGVPGIPGDLKTLPAQP
ncbi:DUF5696 domain-containing protein [candidate division KSB1 bacterium]